MALEVVTPRQPGQRTLPDRTVQRGQRAAAASSSRAGCTQGPRPRLRGPWALIFTVLLLVKAASAKSIRNDEFHQQSSAPLEQSPQQKLCPPGEEEKNCCILIEDTKCQCKSGTFRGEDAPEFCQKCSTRCPDGKDMDMNCTLRSNIKCVDQESSTLAHGEAPVPGELTTMSQRLPITPSPSSGSSRLVIGIVTGIVITVFLIGCMVWCCLKGLFNECWHKKKKLQKTTPSPEMQQADCLLKPAAPEGSQRRRWLLVPTDATERDLPDPGIEPTCPVSPSLQASSLPMEPSGKHYCFMPVQM